jgi:hypothetical protein
MDAYVRRGYDLGLGMSKTIVTRVDTWPIVVSAIYGKEHSEPMLREAYALWTDLMLRGQHVLIMDMTMGTAGATAAQRARVAAWIEANDALLRAKRQLAHIFVLDSAIMRGVITAVEWLRPPVNPHHTARNVDEAVDQAVMALREEGVPISPALIAEARKAGARRDDTLRSQSA